MKTLSNKLLSEQHINLIEDDEVFTQVDGWPGYYISNYGRLISTKGKRYILRKPSIANGGYLQYILYKPARKYKGQKVRDKNGKTKNQSKHEYAHRLTAIAYVRNGYPKVDYNIDDLHVHHKDGRRTNNYYKNLIWLSDDDHAFVHSHKLATYNINNNRITRCNDIDRLANKVKMSVIDLIDTLRDDDPILQSPDGLWDIYLIGNHHVAVQYLPDWGRRPKRRKSA